MLLSVVSKSPTCSYNSCANVYLFNKINHLCKSPNAAQTKCNKMVRLKKQQAQIWGVIVSDFAKIFYFCLFLVHWEKKWVDLW